MNEIEYAITNLEEFLEADIGQGDLHMCSAEAALTALREQAERESAKRFNVQADMFGEYCLVPTGYSGEKHIYKIVSHFRSNSYCETPLMHDSKPTLHESIADVLNVIHCGLDETKVERVALSNVELCGKRLEVEHDNT